MRLIGLTFQALAFVGGTIALGVAIFLLVASWIDTLPGSGDYVIPGGSNWWFIVLTAMLLSINLFQFSAAIHHFMPPEKPE